VAGLGAVIGSDGGIEVPPLAQLLVEVRARGPQRKNATDPPKFVAPPTVTTAWSLTLTDPVPMDRPAGGIRPPVPVCGVVTVPEVHEPNPPRTKSLRVAVGEVEERVSDAKLAKHSPPRLMFEALRLTPPS